MNQPINTNQQAAHRTYWQTPEDDNQRLQNLCGPMDCNIQRVRNALQVNIYRHGRRFVIEGEPKRCYLAQAFLVQLYPRSASAIDEATLEHTLMQLNHQLAQTPEQAFTTTTEHSTEPSNHSLRSHNQIENTHSPNTNIIEQTSTRKASLRTRYASLYARNTRQQEYLKSIAEHPVAFGIGPAGTGKTFLAVACAIQALEHDSVKRIILTRPAVEAGERLGFLPGDLNQKVDPYLRPLYDALYELAGLERVHKWLEKQLIEIAPLAYMRGRTLNHSFIILDEAQNTTPEQMKMFLTRLGFGSQMVITGDPTQVDLPRGQNSGLAQALHILKGIQGIGLTQFTAQEVVRHPLVAHIVEAYEHGQGYVQHANQVKKSNQNPSGIEPNDNHLTRTENQS